MRVVQVNYAFDGRLKTAEDLLVRYTTLTGWASAVAAAGAEVLTVQQFHSSANVSHDRLPYLFGSFGEIAAAAAAFRPDVVHVNGLSFPVRTSRLRMNIARTSDVHPKLVVQSHSDGGVIGRAPWLRVAGRIRRSSVDAYLFAVREHADAWRAAGIVAPEALVFTVMPASTDVRAMPVDEARSASGVTGDPALLWIGRLNPNKDPLTVLDGFERFAARHAAATLTMIFHEGDLVDEVRARVSASVALRARVRLVGAVPHDRIAAFLTAANLFIVGSHHEGSGYSLMEALACGATPVVTDIPTFRALTSNIGCLWTPGDADACARALASAARTRDRQRVIDHFEKNLTWEAVGRRAVEIYAEVLRAEG
jgi:glycosyltransferase involved in cell wall biosynthesis